MKYAYGFLIACICASIFSACKTSDNSAASSPDNFRIGFYNVENLFDTKDDPDVDDAQFLPDSEKKYTEERYQKKLSDLADVINWMGQPALLGVCEVENKGVMEDLAAQAQLQKTNYKIVHRDSPDGRGIDVGLFYNADLFSVKDVETLRVYFPETIEDRRPTRDVLHATLELKGTKETLHVFVNHWSSRRGGLAASEPKRLIPAGLVNKRVKEIEAADANANIIIMGDFNDEPTNNSVLNHLLPGTSLTNLSATADAKGEGTYNYKGNWNMLDQIIVSRAMQLEPKLSSSEAVIFKRDEIIYKDKKYGDKPSRTYGGPNYYGGYSDHFPVYIDVNYTK